MRALGLSALAVTGDIEIVGVVVDDNADSAGALDAGGLKNVVPFGITLDDQNLFLKQFAAKVRICFDEDERDLQAGKLIDHGPSHLAVTTDDEVIAAFGNVDVVDHGSPGLHALAVEKS